MSIAWETARVRVLWGERVRCEPSWRLGRRGSDNAAVASKYSLWFVWGGRGTVQFDVTTIPLRTGICLWMRPGRQYPVEQDLSDRLGVSVVHFDLLGPDGRQLAPDERFPPEIHDVADFNLTDAVLKRIVELIGQVHERQPAADSSPRQVATLLLEALLRDIDAHCDQLEALQEDSAARLRRQEMLRLAALIRENSGMMPSIRELAEQAGYSPDHFARVFEGVIGMSPQTYEVQVRINRARQLLLSTDLSVSEIAEALGYQDVFFFSRQFKQKVGVPPSHYRRHAAALALGKKIG